MTRKIVYIAMSAILFVGATAFRPAEPNLAEFALEYANLRYQKTFTEMIYVGALRQKLYFIKDGKIEKEYDISTSRKGCGMENKSEKTPLGLHKIQNKIGNKAPLGGIISGVNYTGKVAEIETRPVSTGKDDVTTRAMRLEGTEPGYNKGGKYDSFLREIYIHGTPEEGLIGQPVSHGCVRMRNREVIELFDLVKPGMYVLILEN